MSATKSIDLTALDVATRGYVEQFEALERAHRGPTWLTQRRQSAIEAFAAHGFPIRRHEEWRSTPLKRIVDAGYVPVPASASESVSTTAPLKLDGAIVLRTENGKVGVANTTLPTGVRAFSLANVLANADAKDAPPAVLARFLDTAKEMTPLASLNTAFFDDGIVLTIDDDVVIDAPVVIEHALAGTDSASAVFPRILLALGANAKARVIETWTHEGPKPTLANAVTEIHLDTGAHLEHVLVHDAGAQSSLILSTAVSEAENASYTTRTFWLSQDLVRHDLQVALEGEGATCSLDGLALTGGTALVDGHYAVDHVVGNCESEQRFRTVLDDKSTAVFNGKVVMREGADKSDAKQENRNLLLSRDAEIYAKPQLEIFADDVKASHGSTVGQLDEDALFYLQARGIGREEAQRLLVSAFAKSLVDDIQLEDVATQVRALVDARLEATVGATPPPEAEGNR